MKKVLLREFFELCEGGICQDLLTEAEKRKVAEGAVILTGVMQRADEQNGNGRVYPYETLCREIENYKKLVRDRRAFGELDHPDDSVINLKNASHLVIDIWMDGKNAMGKIEVLDTPSGKILKSLVKADCKLGISSRGLGSVHESQGKTIVEEDYQLICFDMVSEPSTQGAFVEARLYEGKDINIFTKGDKINRLLNDIITIGDYK